MAGLTEIQLYAAPDKDGGRVYLTNNNKYEHTTQCGFKNEHKESNRFQIVREKDGWLATAHDDYVVFHVRIFCTPATLSISLCRSD